MSESIRPDAVAQLVEILGDDTLSTDARIELVMNSPATAAERYAAAQTFAGSSVGNLVRAGVLHESSPPTILDATLSQLQSVAAAYGVLARWDIVITRRHMTLLNALKLIPPEDAETVVDLLRRGGLLPPNLDRSAS